MTPYGRIGEPEDCASSLAVLCVGNVQWINDKIIFANHDFSEARRCSFNRVEVGPGSPPPSPPGDLAATGRGSP